MKKDKISDKDFELIQNLCIQNNFQIDNIGNYIRIYDGREEWYVENKDYGNDPIYLYHGNTKGKAGVHRQGMGNPWNGGFSNWYKLIAYIRNHKAKEKRSFEQVFKMKALFESLNLH